MRTILLAIAILLAAPVVAEARIVIDKSSFTLRYYAPGGQLQRTYPIATGLPGFDTPEGRFRILNEVREPAWRAPKSSWVPPNLRGKTVPGGSTYNPLRGYWFTLSAPSTPPGSIGIHGTAVPASMRSRASHGCVRLLERHAIALAKVVSPGERVLIKP